MASSGGDPGIERDAEVGLGEQLRVGVGECRDVIRGSGMRCGSALDLGLEFRDPLLGGAEVGPCGAEFDTAVV